MSPLRDVLEQLLERRDLSEAQAEELLTRLTNPEDAPAMAGAILAALRSKGVVADELRGFARAMRTLARRPEHSGEACAPSTSSAPAAMPRAASIFPPARRCSPPPAACRWSSTATVRFRAAPAAPTCSRHSA